MTMDSSGVNQIVSALQVVYEPKSTNDRRREAQIFLETIKSNDESPYWGYQLALPENNGDNYIVRHFGLSLLQDAINKKFHTFNLEKSSAIRHWIVELGNKILESDPHYLKEKLAFLWVAIAKRTWGNYLVKVLGKEEADKVLEQDKIDGWTTMDSDLWNLWNTNLTCRELSLVIIRTLFEDIYLLDDPIATKRTTILNQLLVLIVTPDSVLNQIYEPNVNLSICKHTPDVKAEGWFVAWSKYLLTILQDSPTDSPLVQNFVPKILSTFKTCLHWIQPSVLRDENIMQTLINILTLTDVKLKTLAVDCLHIIFTRNYSNDEDFQFFIGLIYTTEGISKLSMFYEALEIDPDDVDEQVYSLLKKTVEMIVSLSEYLNITHSSSGTASRKKLSWESEDVDIDLYLKLVLTTTNHPSLIISGLSLQMWVTILRYDELSSKPPMLKILMDLLEISANRTISYNLVDDENISKKFLDVDFDSAPDANSFLMNYKKFNEDIVRITICKKPEDGLSWLENRLQNFF